MSRPYLHSNLIKQGKCLRSEDDHHILCDGHNHYHLYDAIIKPIEGCYCEAIRQHPLDTWHGPFPLNHKDLARPRYEVYNKDEDFFHDHETGAMVWLKLSAYPKKSDADCYVGTIINKIINLLNRDDNAALLLVHPIEKGETDINHS